jgi:hypothetical protein
MRAIVTDDMETCISLEMIWKDATLSDFCMGGCEEKNYLQECDCEEKNLCVIFGLCNSLRVL